MSSVPLHSHTVIDNAHWDIPDKPINYSVSYRSRERGSSRHFGFFPFFAKKPWPVVQEYIKYYTAPGELVCDPFVGSGVTAVEALVLGRRIVASDINPVARFITRMKAIAPVDVKRLRLAFEKVRVLAQANIEALDSMPESAVADLLQTLDYPKESIPTTVRRGGAQTVDYLHTRRQLVGLTILRDAIQLIDDVVLRDLLKIAFANTVRYANKTYVLPSDKGKRRSPFRGDAGFLRWFSYTLTKPEKFYEHHVWPAFEHAFRAVIEAKEETNHLIDGRFTAANFVLADVTASRIHEVTGEATVDYCFADPPYSNDIHFLDLSTLWASWLGLEITDEIRRDELIIGGTQKKTRQQFESEFVASMEAIARALKPDRWFTLVFKHRDLGLWQTVVSACEASSLQYVNSVWQDINIRSTRQIGSPDIIPTGDMYINFRKRTRHWFEAVNDNRRVLDLPTIANYVEREVGRLIVTYLGADIKLITSGVIQQALNSGVFRNYNNDPTRLQKDVNTVLEGSQFTVWELPGGMRLWVMAPNTQLDSSLPVLDRARYYVFEFLRDKGEATVAEITRYVLTRLAQAPAAEREPLDIKALLRNVGTEVTANRWRFDTERITKYKQLRLLFFPSRADWIRESIRTRETDRAANLLHPNLEGFALLHDRLAEANASNKHFDSQWLRLLEVLNTILGRLEGQFGDQIEQVVAVGDWVHYGVDLRNLPFEEVLLLIVLRSDKRSFALEWQLADEVFTDLGDDDIVIQFRLETLVERKRAEETIRARKQEDVLGISLLKRI